MQLLARLSFRSESVDKPFYYTRDHNILLNLLENQVDKLSTGSIEVGKSIFVEDKKLTIKNVKVFVNSEISDERFGISIYSDGENHPYNIDIVITVDDEDAKLLYK